MGEVDGSPVIRGSERQPARVSRPRSPQAGDAPPPMRGSWARLRPFLRTTRRSSSSSRRSSTARQLRFVAGSVVIGASLGAAFGAVPLTSLGAAWPIPSYLGFATLLLGGLLGGLIGYVIGDTRSFGYRLQAQSALCQLQSERNTAALARAVSARSRVRRRPVRCRPKRSPSLPKSSPPCRFRRSRHRSRRRTSPSGDETGPPCGEPVSADGVRRELRLLAASRGLALPRARALAARRGGALPRARRLAARAGRLALPRARASCGGQSCSSCACRSPCASGCPWSCRLRAAVLFRRVPVVFRLRVPAALRPAVFRAAVLRFRVPAALRAAVLRVAVFRLRVPADLPCGQSCACGRFRPSYEFRSPCGGWSSPFLWSVFWCRSLLPRHPSLLRTCNLLLFGYPSRPCCGNVPSRRPSSFLFTTTRVTRSRAVTVRGVLIIASRMLFPIVLSFTSLVVLSQRAFSRVPCRRKQ